MPTTRPARKEEGPRDVYLSKDDFRTHGFTEGCEGCSRMAAGVAARPHTKQCRARMKEAIKSTPDGKRRLEEDERKVHEFLERKLLEEHGDKDESERPGITGRHLKRPNVETKTVQCETVRPESEVSQARADEKAPKPSSDKGPPCATPGARGEATDSNQ